jgi:3-oxoacyl-[acyl-carrier protein] reductase
LNTLFVTGASRGLGAYIAEGLRTEYRIIGLARSWKIYGKPVPFQIAACDVASPDSVAAAVEPWKEDRSVYGVINAAGIAEMSLALMARPESMQSIIQTNLLGTMFVSQAVGRLLVRRRAGRIINFSSIAAALAIKGESVYAASKAGVESFTRTFAREMGDFNVTVNAIAPGPIPTDMTNGIRPEVLQGVVNQQAIRRMATPEDVLNVVRLLLDERAGMVSGEVIHLGGA